MTVMLATEDKDLGLVPAKTAKVEAQKAANEEGKPVTMRDPTTDKVLGTVKPAKGPKGAPKARKVAKVAKVARKAGKARKATPVARKAAPKGEGRKEPRGNVVEILKLASRAKGVSPQELNDLTKWKGAPWKWLFQNPKKTGYADRWGYKFEVLNVDGETRYKVVKK